MASIVAKGNSAAHPVSIVPAATPHAYNPEIDEDPHSHDDFHYDDNGNINDLTTQVKLKKQAFESHKAAQSQGLKPMRPSAQGAEGSGKIGLANIIKLKNLAHKFHIKIQAPAEMGGVVTELPKEGMPPIMGEGMPPANGMASMIGGKPSAAHGAKLATSSILPGGGNSMLLPGGVLPAGKVGAGMNSNLLPMGEKMPRGPGAGGGGLSVNGTGVSATPMKQKASLMVPSSGSGTAGGGEDDIGEDVSEYEDGDEEELGGDGQPAVTKSGRPKMKKKPKKKAKAKAAAGASAVQEMD